MGQGGVKYGQQNLIDKHSAFRMILVFFEKYFLMKKEQLYGFPLNAPFFMDMPDFCNRKCSMIKMMTKR